MVLFRIELWRLLEELFHLILKKKVVAVLTPFFFIRGFAYTPLTKKPSEVRMGGGKGSKLRSWVLPVYPGKTLFEIFFINKNLALQLFGKARKKLGVSTSIVFR